MPASPSTPLPDDDLFAAIHARQPLALQALYDRYFAQAFALAWRMLAHAEAAETCVQDAFIAVWHDPHDLPAGRFLTWLLQLVHLRARQQRLTRRPPTVPTRPLVATVPAQPSLPARASRDHAFPARAATAGAHLSPQERQVLEFAYFECLTCTEIARRLGEDRETILSVIQQGMRKLQTAAARTGAATAALTLAESGGWDRSGESPIPGPAGPATQGGGADHLPPGAR